MEGSNLLKAEGICYEIGCGIKALMAIQDAIGNGPNNPKEYSPALYCVQEYLRERNEAMSACIEAEFAKGRGKTA